MNAMNTNNTNNTNVQSLTAAIAALTKVLEEAIDIAKEESTTATTGTTATTEATITEAPTATETTATTEAPIIVLDDDDSVAAVGFKGSMNEQDPMDPIPAVSEAKADDTAEAEETVPADDEADEEDNTEFKGSMIEQDPTADISALYDIAEFALSHEGKNIDRDKSPYAPKENKVGVIGDYQVFISKVTKDNNTGSFRLIIKDKTIVTPIMELEFRLIDRHYKIFSSENTSRMEKMKESHDLMRFLEITEEVSALVMSRYIAD